MIDPTNEFGRIEVRDAKGAVLETYVPEPVFRAVNEDRAAIEERLTKLESERDRLRQELEKAQGERDRYAASLRTALGADLEPVTPEELEEYETRGVSKEELLAEIDRLFPLDAVRS